MRQRGLLQAKTVDVFTLCGLFSLEVICKCAFNRDFGETPDGGSLDLLTAMDRSAQLFPILAVMPFLKSWGIGRHLPGSIGTLFRGFDTWVSSTRSLVNSFQQHENALDKTQRFMATPLLTNRDDFLGRQLTPDEVIEESMGIAFAGSGTTSTTLVYLLYAMARPESKHQQLKLHEEVKLAGDSLQEVKDLPLSQRCDQRNDEALSDNHLHPATNSGFTAGSWSNRVRAACWDSSRHAELRPSSRPNTVPRAR